MQFATVRGKNSFFIQKKIILSKQKNVTFSRYRKESEGKKITSTPQVHPEEEEKKNLEERSGQKVQVGKYL